MLIPHIARGMKILLQEKVTATVELFKLWYQSETDLISMKKALTEAHQLKENGSF